MDDEKEFDFLFVVTVIPVDSSGGSRVLFSLARGLSDIGYNVGWVLFLNPYHFIYKVTRNPSLLGHVTGIKATVSALWNEFFQSPLGSIARWRYKKKILGSGYYLEGISIVYPSLLKKLKFKRLIASPWESAYFVNYYDADCAKYNIVQYCVDPGHIEDYLGGLDVNLVSQTLSFPLKKIVLNDEDLAKYIAEKPQKLQLGISSSKYYQKVPFDRRDGKIVLFPLRNPVEKGASVAIDAIKLIHGKRKDIKLITFGGYSHTDLIPEYVDHRGYVSDEALFDLYNSASIFVIPSIAEGFCLPGLEAMACGFAVIAADNTGIREYIKNNVNGVIVPSNNATAMAEAVISLIDDQAQRNSLILNGFETAKNFSEENMVKSFLSAIKEFELAKP